MSLFLISGPNNAGPGEREEMLAAAQSVLERAGVDRADVVRIDVPGRGAGEEGEGSMRAELEPAVPILQSGSLFGESQGLMLVDAHLVQAGEARILAELIRHRDPTAVTVVLVSGGRLLKALADLVKEAGETISVAKMWERQAGQWLDKELRSRDLVFEKGAGEALVQRFGTDTAAMSRALDQLREHRGKITAELILARFRNRPEEPLFLFLDAVEKGNAGEALRRLADFLTHGHPLQVIGAMDGDLRRRSLAAAAPDRETLSEWLGAKPSDRRTDRLWRMRGQVPDSSLRRAQSALLRADRALKTAPEESHRVTMERLTVAMCRWYAR
ncbi:MAG: DNA polymerase III subunit delta [Acidimicrobiia bacterium]